MSALRINAPGKPVRFVDLGPDAPHRPKGAVPGGVLVVAPPRVKVPLSPVTLERQREAQKRYWEAHGEEVRERRRNAARCARWIIIARGECGRTRGHRGSCTTSERMARLAADRRS